MKQIKSSKLEEKTKIRFDQGELIEDSTKSKGNDEIKGLESALLIFGTWLAISAYTVINGFNAIYDHYFGDKPKTSYEETVKVDPSTQEQEKLIKY